MSYSNYFFALDHDIFLCPFLFCLSEIFLKCPQSTKFFCIWCDVKKVHNFFPHGHAIVLMPFIKNFFKTSESAGVVLCKEKPLQ